MRRTIFLALIISIAFLFIPDKTEFGLAAGARITNGFMAPVTIDTSPSGLTVLVDGVAYNMPQSFDWDAGSAHSVSALSPQPGVPGHRLIFKGWNDLGGQTHPITVPAAGGSYVAAFTNQYLLTMNTGPGGVVTPESGYYDAGSEVNISAAATYGYEFTGWIGSGNGSYTGPSGLARVTMNGPMTQVAGFAGAPINSPPVAVDDSFNPPGRFVPVLIPAPGVLINDYDADGDALTVQLVDAPSHGSLTLQSNGGFTYSWYPGWAATDTFTYRVSDGKTTSNTASVTIHLFSNQPPVATDDSYTINQDHPLVIMPPGVLANDKDSDGDPLLAHIYAYPSHGSVNFDLRGGFTYFPQAGFTGTDSFTYRADDGTAMRSNEATVTITVTPALPTSSIQCLAASYGEYENEGWVDMTVTRSGDASAAASVDFSTVDLAGLQDCNERNGIASPRCDFILSSGTINFAPGETVKVTYISIIDDAYAEGDETFNFQLSNAKGATLGTPASATITIHDNDYENGINPIDETDFFIRELYLDFLNREPEPKGLEDWHRILVNCQAQDMRCDRIEVASAFFRSPEFQERGYFVYRLYPLVGRTPLNHEFMPDLANVSGFLTNQQLEAKKVAMIDEFMARPEFQTKYGGTLNNPQAFLNELLQNCGLMNHPRRQLWIDSMTNGSLTTGQVVRELVDSPEMFQKYYSEAFVVMSYFGYLRRSADSLYRQWVDTLNQSGGTDYRLMVNGFLNSPEYRKRFGP